MTDDKQELAKAIIDGIEDLQRKHGGFMYDESHELIKSLLSPKTVDIDGLAKLKEFARWVINQECFANDIDGASIQEKAEELGLIKLDNVTAEDVETHDYYTKEDIGDLSIYRFTDILEEK